MIGQYFESQRNLLKLEGQTSAKSVVHGDRRISTNKISLHTKTGHITSTLFLAFRFFRLPSLRQVHLPLKRECVSLSPYTIRRRHAAASSCTSCVPHGRTTGPTSPGTALLCYSVVLCLFCASERPRSTTASSSSRVPAPSLRQVVLPVS